MSCQYYTRDSTIVAIIKNSAGYLQLVYSLLLQSKLAVQCMKCCTGIASVTIKQKKE